MSIRIYEYFKNKFERTIPIRGRAVECRPFGQRREDWKEIVRVLTPFGESYGARLYQTDCVVVAPNGDMYIKTGGWATPITAEWIAMRSGLSCYKKYNKVWIDVDGRSIPLDTDKPVHIKWNEDTGKYSCDKEVVMSQKVVDKDKIKEVRHSIKEFKTFTKTMMTLADGWVSRELLTTYRSKQEGSGYWSNYTYEVCGETFTNWELRGDRMNNNTAQRFIKCMQDATDDADKVKLMLMVATGCNSDENRVVAIEEYEREYDGKVHKYQNEVREYRYNPKTVVNRIDYILKKGADVFTTKEVVVTKPITNIG
jgi:hypothetical protein